MQVTEWHETGDRFEWRGQEIFYQESGEGEVIFLIHGFLMPSWVYKDIWPLLSKDYRVVAPDFVGFGYSSKPTDYEYSFDERAEMIYALADLLNVKSIHILASSFGVSITQELLLRCHDGRSPIDIQSVSLMNGALFPHFTTDTYTQKVMLYPILNWISLLYNNNTFRKVLNKRTGKYSKFPKQLVDELWDMHLEKNGSRLLRKLNTYIKERNAKAPKWIQALLATEIPVQLIWGIDRDDQISGLSMPQEYRKHKGDQYVVMLKDIGHFPHVECPELVVEYYTSFLKGLKENAPLACCPATS